MTDITDESIYVGGPPERNPTIEIVESDPAWPSMYAVEEARIRQALGDAVVLLEHTGSTSVPGLAAKPVIDITLAVPDSADEPAYVPALEAAGFRLRLREPDWFDHRLLKGPAGNVNLHVFTAGCPEIDRMIRFRDRLRASAADRARYEETKRKLAARDWEYRQDYADAKSEVVEDILTNAAGAGGHPLDRP